LDAIWHIWLGGFGNDFLWPPHLILYGSFLVNTIISGFFLGRILSGGGDPRVRARQEPALGIRALTSAYMIFSLPSDLVWHKIYGLDITAWSPPHALIMLSAAIVAISITSMLVTSLKPNEKSRLVQAGVIVAGACAMWIPLLGLSA